MPKATMYFNQNVDIDASVEQIDSAAPTNCLQVTIKALAVNTTNIIYVGLTGVTTAIGHPLAGGESLTLYGDYNRLIDATLLYGIGSTTNLLLSITCISATPL